MMPTRHPLETKRHTHNKKERDRKRYFMQMEILKSWGSNTYYQTKSTLK